MLSKYFFHRAIFPVPSNFTFKEILRGAFMISSILQIKDSKRSHLVKIIISGSARMRVVHSLDSHFILLCP